VELPPSLDQRGVATEVRKHLRVFDPHGRGWGSRSNSIATGNTVPGGAEGIGALWPSTPGPCYADSANDLAVVDENAQPVRRRERATEVVTVRGPRLRLGRRPCIGHTVVSQCGPIRSRKERLVSRHEVGFEGRGWLYRRRRIVFRALGEKGNLAFSRLRKRSRQTRRLQFPQASTSVGQPACSD